MLQILLKKSSSELYISISFLESKNPNSKLIFIYKEDKSITYKNELVLGEKICGWQ